VLLLYYEPINGPTADRVLQTLLVQLEQNRMKQRVRKDKRLGRSPDTAPLPETPGGRIAHLRKKRKLTQKALAETVGITSATLSKYESGGYPFRTDLLIRFSRELKASADFILCLAEQNERNDPPATIARKEKSAGRVNIGSQPKKSEEAETETHLLSLFRSLSEPHKRLLIDMIRLFCNRVDHDPECFPEVVFYQMR